MSTFLKACTVLILLGFFSGNKAQANYPTEKFLLCLSQTEVPPKYKYEMCNPIFLESLNTYTQEIVSHIYKNPRAEFQASDCSDKPNYISSLEGLFQYIRYMERGSANTDGVSEDDIAQVKARIQLVVQIYEMECQAY